MVIESKQLREFPGYRVFSDGRIWSYHSKKFLKLNVNDKGYLVVQLCCEGVQKEGKVHRLVLEAFVGPCPEGMEGCHENDVKNDNQLENLYWGTHLQNMRDCNRNGKHPKSKLTMKEVKKIKESLIEDDSFSNRKRLSKKYRVGICSIYDIWKGRTYEWVGENKC